MLSMSYQNKKKFNKFQNIILFIDVLNIIKYHFINYRYKFKFKTTFLQKLENVIFLLFCTFQMYMYVWFTNTFKQYLNRIMT